jgi:hypothetical protein
MPDSQRTAPTRPETPANLLQSQLSNIHSLSIRCLCTVVAAWRRASAALRSTSRGLRHRSAYLLKTFGVLVAIAFGTASVVYAKQAADDARCQLRLAERQYCEAASEVSAQSSECQDILRVPLSKVLCYAWPVYFWVFTLAGPYQQVFLCGRSWGMIPWYSYLVPSRWHYSLRGPPSYVFDVGSMPTPKPWYYRLLPSYWYSSLASWPLYVFESGHTRSTTPWYYSLGIPYQQQFGPKPRFWRFPDLYTAAEFFRGRVGTSLVCVGIAFMGWISLQRHGFLSRGVLYLLVTLQLGVAYLSWRLLEDDLVFQRKYWDGRVGHWEAWRNFSFHTWDNAPFLNETKP